MKQYSSLKKKVQNTLERGSNMFRTLPRGESVATMTWQETDTVVTSATTTDTLTEFRSYLKKEKGFDKSKLMSNKFLVRFLRCAEMDTQKALTVWRAYWRLYQELALSYRVQPLNLQQQHRSRTNTMRSNMSLKSGKTTGFEKFVPFEVPKVAACLSTGWIQCPPSRDNEGCQVLYIYPSKFDAYQFSTVDVCAALMNLTNSLLSSVHTQQNGFCIVVDAAKSKIKNLDVRAIQKTLFVLLKCLPIKINKLLIIGFPTYARVLWRGTQEMFSAELRHNAEIIRGKSKEAIGFELDEYIEQSQRPGEYDGTLDWDVDSSMKEWVLSEMML